MFKHMCVCAPVASHWASAVQERKQQAAAHKAAEDKAAAEAAAAEAAAGDAAAGGANPDTLVEADGKLSNPEVAPLLQIWLALARQTSDYVPCLGGLFPENSIACAACHP